MFSKPGHTPARTLGLCARAGTALLVLCLSLAVAGCASQQLAKHSTALAAATAPVVDGASAAYRTAQAIHAQSVDYDAAADFDKSNVFVPGSIQDWPPEKEIQERLAILAALQVYVKDLVAITNGTDSPALDAASKSMGDSLTTVANTLAPPAEAALGITTAPSSTSVTTTTTTTGTTTTTTTSTDSTLPPFIGPAAQKGITLALNALGQFLIERTIDKELPQKVEAMDPTVEALCNLLENDVNVLQEQEKLDSNDVIDRQTAFARDTKLDPEERRTEFLKLPEMAREQRANSRKLADLRGAILQLYLTHHALAAAAQGNNPESFKQKLLDLEPAGESLGKLYASLAAQ